MSGCFPREKEGVFKCDRHWSHAGRPLPATRELEVNDGFVKFRILRQKVAYRFCCVIIVEPRENHGNVDQCRPVGGRRAQLKVHGVAQQNRELPPQICCRCRFSPFAIGDFARHLLSAWGCSACLSVSGGQRLGGTGHSLRPQLLRRNELCQLSRHLLGCKNAATLVSAASDSDDLCCEPGSLNGVAQVIVSHCRHAPEVPQLEPALDVAPAAGQGGFYQSHLRRACVCLEIASPLTY